MSPHDCARSRCEGSTLRAHQSRMAQGLGHVATDPEGYRLTAQILASASMPSAISSQHRDGPSVVGGIDGVVEGPLGDTRPPATQRRPARRPEATRSNKKARRGAHDTTRASDREGLSPESRTA